MPKYTVWFRRTVEQELFTELEADDMVAAAAQADCRFGHMTPGWVTLDGTETPFKFIRIEVLE